MGGGGNPKWEEEEGGGTKEGRSLGEKVCREGKKG